MKTRVCMFCSKGIKGIDYKEAESLRKYLSFFGKIEGRRRTSACAYHQRRIAQAIKRSRHLALLPFVNK